MAARCAGTLQLASCSRRSGRCRQLSRVGRPAAVGSQDVANRAISSAEAEANRLGQQLRLWLEDEGGYVHPGLQLSLATPHGSRGVVAAEAIPPSLAERQAMIAVPEHLLLTAEAAVQRLGPLLQRAVQAQRQRQPWWRLAQHPIDQFPPLDPPLLLALLLATERQEGPASRYLPYIATLPKDPPCAWAMGPAQLASELAGMGPLAAGWSPQVASAAAAVQQRTEAVAAAYGEPLGVSASDIRWAWGHVLSRSFGSGQDLALLPFIDLANHRQHAAQPEGLTSEAGQPCAAVYSRHRGVPQALPAGAEFCISYVADTSTPLQMFLNFGWVPEEFRGTA